MTNTEDIKQNWLKAFESFEKGLNGQSKSLWHQKRKEAMSFFAQLGFPTTKHEEWKYTNVAKLMKQDLKVGQNSDLTLAAIQEKVFLPNLESNVLTFVNGIWREDLSKILDTDLTIKPLQEVSKENPDLLEKYFAQNTNDKEEAFTALNTAFAQEGFFIHVPKNTVAKYPIALYFISDTRVENIVAQPRNVFVIEQNANCTIIEKYDTLGENINFHNVVNEFDVAPNARVEHYKLQNDSENSYQVNTTQVHQAQDSNYSNTTISLQGAMIRNNLNIALDGQNCEAYMFGLYMADKKTHIDNHSAVDHQKPHSYSEELYKGILDDHSTGVFNGKIFVRQDAQKTNAYQQNRNILLSDTATINTKPQLEIWADDVKCSHGATTGNLDKEALFYLRSRGIGETEARSLLIKAFAGDILEKIKIDSLKEYVEEIVANRLEKN